MTRATALFNEWICRNTAKLRARLSTSSYIDEEAFQDTYLTLATTEELTEDSRTFEKAFIQTYKKFSKKNMNESYTICYPDELFFTLLPADDPKQENEAIEIDTENVARKIKQHIRETFPRSEVRIIELKMQGFSYRDISDTLGIGTNRIINATNRIITQARLKFELVAL